jgi:hypothetical protein
VAAFRLATAEQTATQQTFATEQPAFGFAGCVSRFGTGIRIGAFTAWTTSTTFGTGTTFAIFGTGSTLITFGTGTTFAIFGTRSTLIAFGTGSTFPVFGTGSTFPVFGTLVTEQEAGLLDCHAGSTTGLTTTLNSHDSFIIGLSESGHGGEACSNSSVQHHLRGNHKPPERSESLGKGPL